MTKSGRAMTLCSFESLSFYELGEHFLGIDGDEQPLAAGKHFVFLIEDLRHVGVLPSTDT